ncbi:vegetative cell wall protein gp1-like [Choloepus didactylus]|uniref:vegetative cell wall protein gp1-like n=1 Tax=Choloepus didactylus TaxID=27675 RepID=UPI0018A0A0F4|nr:vegetative cell wall protein gp1-like [Choloepus didactylus]
MAPPGPLRDLRLGQVRGRGPDARDQDHPAPRPEAPPRAEDQSRPGAGTQGAAPPRVPPRPRSKDPIPARSPPRPRPGAGPISARSPQRLRPRSQSNPSTVSSEVPPPEPVQSQQPPEPVQSQHGLLRGPAPRSRSNRSSPGASPIPAVSAPRPRPSPSCRRCLPAARAQVGAARRTEWPLVQPGVTPKPPAAQRYPSARPRPQTRREELPPGLY